MTSTHSQQSKIFRRPSVIGYSVFFAVLAIVALLSYQRYLLFKEARKAVLSNAALHARDKLKSVLDYSSTAAQTLGFIATLEKDDLNFDSVAARLLASHPYVDALELVEGGTITAVFPLAENEAAIGYDILLDSLVNKEAEQAIRRKEIQQWIEHSNEQYQSVLKPLEYKQSGDEGVLTAEVSGTFPGSPIVLQFHLTLKNELIDSLKVTG